MKEVFAMFRVIARERKKREIEPTVRVLRECINESSKPKSAAPYTRDRLTELLGFFEIATNAYEQMEKLPTPAVLKLAKLGDKAFKILGVNKG
jgi:DNA-binding transcriptional regulator GbsR (MarR family)